MHPYLDRPLLYNKIEERRAFGRNHLKMGESRRFEITIVSAANLPVIRRLGLMKVYAKVTLNGNTGLTLNGNTHIDRDGDTSPRWNSRFVFTIDDDSCLRRSGTNVVVSLFCEMSLGDKYIGQARIPLKGLFDMGLTSHKPLGYPISGTAYGTLYIRYWFEDKFVPPPTPAPAPTSKPLELAVYNINTHFIKNEFMLVDAPHVKTAQPLPQGKSMQAAKTLLPARETNAGHLEPRKILPAGETNRAALKSLKASETLLPARKTNMAPLKALEPRKILPAGETNGAALKSLKASETLLPARITNKAPLRALEPRKILPVTETNGAEKSLKASETLLPASARETNMTPLKALEPRKILSAGETNGAAALKSLNSTKALPPKRLQPRLKVKQTTE